MHSGRLISIEDCPNARSTCKDCNLPIAPLSPRVKTESRRYCHLSCYRPRFPVTIDLAQDVVNRLQQPQNSLIFEEWVAKWNSQFQPITTWKVGQPPQTPHFSRGYIEVFKFLTHNEVCRLVGLTCREWRELAWSEELWLSLARRDFPLEVISAGCTCREGYMRLYTQACLACCRLPQQIKVICPVTKRPICASCFQKPGSSVFQVTEYASLLGISQDYMREASIPVYAYNQKNWVFSHQADQLLIDHRAQRRSELLQQLANFQHRFSERDLQKIRLLNLGRAKYIGVVLKHKFEGEEDLIDLLNFIYNSWDGKGMTLGKLIKRNKRRTRVGRKTVPTSRQNKLC